MSAIPTSLTKEHKRQLKRLALVPIIAIPVVLYGAIFLGLANDWDVVDTARGSTMGAMIIIASSVVWTLVLKQPDVQRKRGFVVFWFMCAAILNLIWQLPLSIFQEWIAIDVAPHTWENLAKFTMWWGYGFADHHYGKVTTWMMTEEAWFLLSIAMSVYGLILLRGGKDVRAYLWMGVGGATQSYNASLYIIENGLVDRFSNIPAGSIVSLILYWGFNLFWTAMSLLAAVYCFQFLLAYADRAAPSGA